MTTEDVILTLGGPDIASLLQGKEREIIDRIGEAYSHIDSTFVALRPGLTLCNPARINEQTLPEFLKQWEVIYSPPMESTDRFDAD
jgi:N-dimethylarginine dimethylaminohydrolase